MSEERVPYKTSSARMPPLEALVVDRDRLIRMLRIALADLHERRLQTPQCTGEPDIVELIRYWDTVFGWIKEVKGQDLVLISRNDRRGAP